jgi:hypothetical protein
MITVELFENGNAFGPTTTKKYDLALICKEELMPGSEKIGANLMPWHSPPRDRHYRITLQYCTIDFSCPIGDRRKYGLQCLLANNILAILDRNLKTANK